LSFARLETTCRNISSPSCTNGALISFAPWPPRETGLARVFRSTILKKGGVGEEWKKREERKKRVVSVHDNHWLCACSLFETEASKKRDKQLHNKIEKLATFVQPEHLEIDAEYVNEELWARARTGTHERVSQRRWWSYHG